MIIDMDFDAFMIEIITLRREIFIEQL